MKKDNNSYILTAAITAAIVSSSIALYLLVKENRRKRFAYNKQRNINNNDVINATMHKASSHDIIGKVEKEVDLSTTKIMTG